MDKSLRAKHRRIGGKRNSRRDSVRRNVALHRLKKNKLWLIKAIDRYTGRPIAWVLGGRDTATFRRLYEKVKHCRYCMFFTDAWDTFAKVLPPERHIIGKAHTIGARQQQYSPSSGKVYKTN